MKKSEFQKYTTSRILKEFPELSREIGVMNVNSDSARALGINVIIKPEEDFKISKSLINHFDKLIEVLKNTSDKKLSTPCTLCESDYLKPKDQQFEVYKAIIEFLKIAINRDKHGIRNAFISFTRQRKQKFLRSEENPDGARRGRPNLYGSEEFRYVVNRAAKIQQARKKRLR